MNKIAKISDIATDKNSQQYFIVTTGAFLKNGKLVAPKSIFIYDVELHEQLTVGMEIA
jgi:hypothetical protein